jgi:hypothetical protein
VTASAPGPDTTLLVIAKQPVPGRVKTRLVPPFTHEQAAALAEAALADTLHTTLMARQAPRSRFAARAREFAAIAGRACNVTEGTPGETA